MAPPKDLEATERARCSRRHALNAGAALAAAAWGLPARPAGANPAFTAAPSADAADVAAPLRRGGVVAAFRHSLAVISQ